MNPATPEVDLVEYPKIEIAGKLHELKLTCGTILRLKKSGVDLFAQPPYDKHAAKSAALLSQAKLLTEKETLSEDETAERDRLFKEAGEEWEKVSAERRAWEHPLDVADPILRMENAFKVVAACLSTSKKTLAYEDIADDVLIGQEMADVLYAVAIAAKKALSQIANAQTPKSVLPSIQ